MPSRKHLAPLRAASALIAGLLIWLAASSAHAQTRIMPLGDSITGSPGCWRAILWNNLRSRGFTDIDFVGTLPPQSCGVAHDGDNEGHGGIQATNMANQNQLPPWLAATRPDIVMMHLGTNDVWGARSTDVILAAFTRLVDQMRAQNPRMKILVAQIIPMSPANCPQCAQRVIALNAAIPSWAAGKTTSQSPIVVVDQWTGFNDASDTGDGVHPNASGNQKIADRWLPALTALLPGNAPSFALSVSPAAISLGLGASATATVTISASGGFTAPVNLSASGLPPGVTAAIAAVSSSGTATVTLSAARTATPGVASVTVTGTGGGLTRTATFTLTITSTTGGGGPATATPVVAASGPWFNEEQVRIANTAPLTALTLTITVQTTGGVAFNGQYDTAGMLVQSHSSTATSVVYEFSLPAGQSLPPGTGWTFAAQSTGSGAVHPTAGDTFTLRYTAGGVAFTASGNFDP